jgi:hypothetical protein
MSDDSPVSQRHVDRRDLIVVGSGLVTTLLAFACVWWSDRAGGEHILGQYAFLWGIIPLPVGALGTGLAASLGYGAASYLTQRKVSGGLLGSMLVLLVGSYFAAQVAEYRVSTTGLGDGAIGFWDWFDRTTRALAWTRSAFDDRPGEPLGALGYALRALEIAGFAAGGLIVPAALRNKPYCDACRCYRQKKLAAIVPVGGDEAEAHRRLQTVLRAARTGSRDELAQAIVRNAPLSQRRQAEDSTHWLSASLIYCLSCADGTLAAASHQRSSEARRQISQVTTEVVALEPRLVRELLEPRRRGDEGPYR